MMQKRQITCEIAIAKELAELSAEDFKLVSEAKAALNLSYSPYSKFKVGAAAQLNDGSIIQGANQENASYPLCLCAERVVLAAVSSSHSDKKVESMAIMVHNPTQALEEPASPCGACRQVLSESEDRQNAPIRLLLCTEAGETWIINSVKDILPLSFKGDLLP